MRKFRVEGCVRLRQQVHADPDAQALLKERLAKLQPLPLRLGTGSLERIGLRVSQFTGWTAASGFLVEGLQFVQWLQAEFGLNRAIATQSWERVSWQRDGVNQGLSFNMTFPFLAVRGAQDVRRRMSKEPEWDELNIERPQQYNSLKYKYQQLCFRTFRPFGSTWLNLVNVMMILI